MDGGHGDGMSGHKMGHMEHTKGPARGGHMQMIEDFKKRFFVCLALTIPIVILSQIVQGFFGVRSGFPGSDYLVFLLSTFVYFYGGYPFLKGFLDEMKNRTPGMMTLVTVAISVAYFYSAAVVFGLPGMVFFWELATLIDIMLLGHWLEMRSVMGASRALEELVKVMPSEAHLVHDGHVIDVKVEDLKPGDVVLVKLGEKVPVDGRVTDGETSVNQAMLTGESRPVPKKAGDEVIGGSINGDGSVSVKVEKTGKDTYLSQVVKLVRLAQESKSRAQDLADKAALALVIIVLAAGAVTLAVWLYLGQPLAFAVERMATVMVITCPHALGLAVPLVVAVSTSLAAKSGLLIRDRSAFETARSIQAVVFDKTGTLTEGKFGVTDVIPLGAMTANDILYIAASLEASSEHSIARGILDSAKGRSLTIAPVSDFRALLGRGVEGTVNGKRWLVVSPGYLKENGIEASSEKSGAASREGETVVFLLEGQKPAGAIALADIVRKESREAVGKLKSMGIRCMMLTGDDRSVAKQVAEELGLDEYFAEVLPHEKVEKIKEAQKKYRAAMVGDGINDAPALVQADVGIAIGAGTDVAIESADIVLVGNDPREVVDVIVLSRKTYSKMVQNLLWATGYNAFAIPLAAGLLFPYGIILSPAVGALLMSASTIIVAINARLLKT